MKFKKIFVSCLSAVLFTFSNISAYSVSVTAYDSRDINRDGKMDVFDRLLFDKCLVGKSYISDNEILDVDGNQIVSIADSYCISAGIVNESFSNRVKGYTKSFDGYNTSVGSSTGHQHSTTYMTHNYKRNYNGGYTLKMDEYDFNSAVYNNGSSERSIKGPDSREPDALESVINISGVGTGFIVGDHAIATAAHCVYNRDNGSWGDDLRVYLPDENGRATTTPLTAVEAHIPIEYLRNKYEYDYALITVEEDLSDYYHFSLGMPYNVYTTNSLFGKYTIYTTGYSGKNLDDTDNVLRQMYTSDGKITTPFTGYPGMLCYDTDTTAGNSGGPVYVKEIYKSGSKEAVEQMTVIGIHTRDYNMGPMINAAMIMFYKNNSYIKTE